MLSTFINFCTQKLLKALQSLSYEICLRVTKTVTFSILFLPQILVLSGQGWAVANDISPNSVQIAKPYSQVFKLPAARASIETVSIPLASSAIYLTVLVTNPRVRIESNLNLNELRLRQTANSILFSVQEFLKQVHIADGRSMQGSPLDRTILESFELPVDPLGRLAWSDAGQTAHKVDDYFQRPTLAIVVHTAPEIKSDNILGSIKFVETSIDRLEAPKLASYSGFLPNAVIGSNLNNTEAKPLHLELENFARSRSGINPVPLLLATLAAHPFFNFYLTQAKPSKTGNAQPPRVFLNTEIKNVPRYEALGFENEDGYFPGMEAERMSAPLETFLSQARQNALARSKTNSEIPGFEFIASLTSESFLKFAKDEATAPLQDLCVQELKFSSP